MSDDLVRGLARSLAQMLAPLQRAAEVPYALPEMLSDLGVADFDVTPIANAVAAAAAAKTQIEALADEPVPSLGDIVAVLTTSQQAFNVLRQLDTVGAPAAVLAGIGRDVVEYLASLWLAERHPVMHRIATLLTLIERESDQGFTEPQMQGETLVRAPYRMERFRLSRIASLLTDPVGTMRAAYVTPLVTGPDADAMADALFPKVVTLLRTLGISCRYGVNPGDETLLADSAPLMQRALVVYLTDPVKDPAGEAGVVVSISPAERGDLGLVVAPFGTLQATRFAGPFRIDLDLTAGVDVIAVGRHGLTLRASAGATEVHGSIIATIDTPEDGSPAFMLGSPTGTRLELGGATLKATTALSQSHRSLALSADVTHATLVIAAGEGDGFVNEVLPKDGLRAKFDLGIGWSNDTGFALRGSASLDATFTANASLAGATLSAVHVALQAVDGALQTELSASISASIGPVRVVLNRTGLSGRLTFPETGGNLGVADLTLGFKGPSGVGLAIDAHGVLSGGGFLFHDEARQLYAGAVQLSLHDQLTLTGFGLIATRQPDGSRGFSLIVFITAEGFRPVPLGLGFVLLGIGGMVAVNRTFDAEAMRQGLHTGALATLLFPRDPLGNAPALIQALTRFFPARPGSYLLGVLAKIGWLSSSLVVMDLALILELGRRQRLLVLGRIRTQLPSPVNEQIRLNMEALGVVDFDAGTAALDAVLLDSRLAYKFSITGSAALRAAFGSGSNFVLAAGGLNPHFKRPAGFPTLDRLAIALSSGKNPRLVCEAYFAITANTVQFGARAWLYASAAGFSVEGDVGFDVLVQVVPLHFIVDYHARLQLKRGSHNLFGVEVKGELEGPRPLRLSGKASFKILWFRFSVRFDTTLVHGEPPPLPPAVDVFAQLKEALLTRQNWSVERPAQYSHGVALRNIPAGTRLVLDPLGRFAVKQQVVPLNTGRDIDIFAGAPVVGPRRFRLGVALGGAAVEIPPALQADFAPAQYFSMSDDEKLSAPSFETMDAGFVFGSVGIHIDAQAIVPAPLTYRTIVVPPAESSLAARSVASLTAAAESQNYTLTPEQLETFRRSGAAARAAVRRVARARFHNPQAVPAASFKPGSWAIVPTGEGAAATVESTVRTWSDYQAALNRLSRSGARWQLIPTHELEA